jgi:protein-S-isoprenylcysteine O-methyltransferase Ste14
MLYFGERKNIYVYVLVTLQFICLFLIFLTGPLYPQNFILIAIYISGFILGFWGIVSMNSQTLNIPPNVRPEAELTSKGPYAVIRHPMYTSLILVTLPLVISNPTVFRITVETTLIVDLLVKLNVEEKMLKKQLNGYNEYKQNTWKIIPFVY